VSTNDTATTAATAGIGDFGMFGGSEASHNLLASTVVGVSGAKAQERTEKLGAELFTCRLSISSTSIANSEFRQIDWVGAASATLMPLVEEIRVRRQLRPAAVRYRQNQSPPRLGCAPQEYPPQDRQAGCTLNEIGRWSSPDAYAAGALNRGLLQYEWFRTHASGPSRQRSPRMRSTA